MMNDKVADGIQCDCCGSPMTLSICSDGGGTFSCTSCSQIHSFNKDMRHTRRVVTLFPSCYETIHEMPYKMREEFMSHYSKQVKFKERALYLLGFSTEAEYFTSMDTLENTVNEFREEQSVIDKKWDKILDLKGMLRELWKAIGRS